jgi:hypothetical protein
MSASLQSGSALLEQGDQAQHDRIEMLVHHRRAPFRRVGDLGAERGIVLPALAAGDVEIEIGIEKGAQRAFDRRLAPDAPSYSSSASIRRSLVTTARRANTASNSAFLSAK